MRKSILKRDVGNPQRTWVMYKTGGFQANRFQITGNIQTQTFEITLIIQLTTSPSTKFSTARPATALLGTNNFRADQTICLSVENRRSSMIPNFLSFKLAASFALLTTTPQLRAKAVMPPYQMRHWEAQ